MLLGAGQIIKVEGELPTSKDGPYFYLFNHQSLLDQFVIGAIVKEYLSAVGGDFQFKWPIWGRLIRRIGAIPIVREDLAKAIYSLSLAEVEIKNGTSFMISPEGTRTLTGKMGEFKKGPFHLSLNTGVTIALSSLRLSIALKYSCEARFISSSPGHWLRDSVMVVRQN